MRRCFHQPACGTWFLESFFFQFNLNALSEMNQIWIDSSIFIDGATLNFGSVRLMVREKISPQTDRLTDGHGEYISGLFPMKNAKIIVDRIRYQPYSYTGESLGEGLWPMGGFTPLQYI